MGGRRDLLYVCAIANNLETPCCDEDENDNTIAPTMRVHSICSSVAHPVLRCIGDCDNNELGQTIAPAAYESSCIRFVQERPGKYDS